MNKCLLLVTLFFSLGVLHSNAQLSRYIVRLKDKAGTPYSVNTPSQFLSQRAIDRRIKYGITIDETDLPITPRYIDSIRLAGNVTIINVSKWLNQVCIATTDAAALSKINGFEFVLASSAIAARTAGAVQPVNKQLDAPSAFSPATVTAAQDVADYYDYGASYDQVHLHNGEFLHNYGFRGQGMQMAIMDAGFFNYLNLPTFDSVRNSNRILGTWDFVANNSSVNEDNNHGMKCFSAIAANMPGNFVGTAPEASFYLYRTEDAATEYPIEEQHWAAAAERADSLGVDVVSTSLGYTSFDNSSFNYTYADMNGNSTLIARAANLAVKKGILVVGAAGNEGNSSWRYVTTLGDADSILTIGAVTAMRQAASFSSYGPNSDGQIKPDVAAIGANAVVAATNTGQPVFGNGTSFACPIMAGIGTCLWQAFPELNNMQIMQGLRQTGDRYSNPNDRTGYGIPDVKKTFVQFIQQLHTQTATINNCTAVFNFSVKAAAGMSVEIERMLPSDSSYQAITIFDFTGDFSNRIFGYSDSLSGYTSGVNIRYRFKMNIGTDSSFYLDSVILAYSDQCTVITERKLCPATATYLSVDSLPAGFSYQWQLDTGNGFTDISNNSNYSGTVSRVLVLTNLPQNFYGYQYRCLQTNGNTSFYSTPITIKFSSNWTGVVSTAWEDAGNWSCGIVPTQYIDVVIGNQASNYPVINSNAACHSISTAPGASVTVSNGYRLDIGGH